MEALANRLLTTKDIQERLGVCKDTAYKIVKSNGFPSITIGKSIRIPEEEFNAWIKRYIGKEIII